MRKFGVFLAGAVALISLSFNVALAEDAPDIQKIKDRGVLKVGVKVDVPKFGYKDPKSGVTEGLDIDVAKAIAKKILGDENKIETQAVTAKTRGPLLDNGEVDLVIATFTITPERKQSYNFSDAYFADGIALMVKKNSGIASFKDLNGKKIGVAQSATTKKVIQEKATAEGIKVTFFEFGTYPEIKTALDSKRIDCFSVDGSILLGYLDETTIILDERLSAEEYGVASKFSNKALAELVNGVVNELKSSGELDKLAVKWGLK
ncbi:MAG: transporter substrate-binding domain-containing protein [Campylobacteraceae bacterium]|jgi:putative glutamine transport system substrate-binding protein|nr:transporter substrate-binding domain-containing protein [Campylobacteraceae bacterium]